MNDAATNVVVLNLRRQEAPAPELHSVELHLDQACGFEMVLRNDAGEVVAVLEYTLTAKPKDFDLDALRAAWDRWKGSSAVAS